MFTKDEAFKLIEELTVLFTEQFTSYKKSDYNETLNRRGFINPFFKTPGWDVDISQGYAEGYRRFCGRDLQVNSFMKKCGSPVNK